MNLFLLAVALVNVALVAFPLVTAIPFIRQTPSMLEVAYLAKSAAPAVSVVSLTFTVVMMLRSWRGKLISLTLLLACAVLARVNALEWMFPAAGDAKFASIGSFHDVRDDDMVIGVTVDGAQRAYPVRYLAHHHMLNDTLGARALLPTY
jgi:hypothetical protein